MPNVASRACGALYSPRAACLPACANAFAARRNAPRSWSDGSSSCFIVGMAACTDRPEELHRRRAVRGAGVLAAYFVFTFLAWDSRTRALPRWFVYASIVVDVALLLGSSSRFHIQYRSRRRST